MANDMVLLHCSPTLAGLKTANMFSVAVEDEEEFRRSVCLLNQLLVPRGIRMIPLRYHEGRVLVYVYRPTWLDRDLADDLAREILEGKGYPVDDCHQCVMELIKRLKVQEDFPHEIGLFLGYPPEDVKGFMENEARNAKCVGTWKVYGDEEKAKRKFERYKACTKAYCEYYRKYQSIDQLVVAVS